MLSPGTWGKGGAMPCSCWWQGVLKLFGRRGRGVEILEEEEVEFEPPEDLGRPAT